VGAWLIDWPYIDGAKFGEGIDFRKANFVVLSASFVGARVASSVELGNFWPDRWTTRPAKPGNREDPTFCYLMRVEDGPPPST
jgi:hypothetical protein